MRNTCLYCEQVGTTTILVQTTRGGICPVHSAEFLERLYREAKRTLGLPLELKLLGKGVAKPRVESSSNGTQTVAP